MSCENTAVMAPMIVDSVNPFFGTTDIITLNLGDTLGFASLIANTLKGGGQTCQEVRDFFGPLPPAVGFGIVAPGLFAYAGGLYGYASALGALVDTSAIEFYAHTPATGIGTEIVNVSENGVLVGNYEISYTPAGITGVINNGVPPLLQINVAYPGGSVQFEGGHSPVYPPIPNIQMRVPVSAMVQSVDWDAWLGCEIPECAITPPVTVAPSVGGAVKCANFAKIFNPLGIPLGAK